MGFEKFFSDEGSALPLGLALMRMGGRSDRPRNLGVELGTAFEQQAKMKQAKQQQMMQQLQMERIKAAILKEKKMEGLSEQLANLPPQFMKAAVPGAVDQGMLGPNLPIQSQQGQQLAEQMGSGGTMADLLALNQSANFTQQGTPQEMPLQGQPASMDYKGLMQAQLPILEQMKPGTSFEYAAQQQKSEEDRKFKAEELKQKYLDRVAEIKLRAEEGRITREEADKRMIEARREAAKLAAAIAQSGRNVQPYSSPYDAASGTLIFDHRAGKFTPALTADGKPIVKASSSPDLQGGLSSAKAAGKEFGESGAKATIDLPKNIQEAANTVTLVDELLDHPGLKQAVGKSSLIGIQKIPGTEAKAFMLRLDQLKGKQFLQAYETLKGGGQITEVEGQKATQAMSRMDNANTENEFRSASKEFQEIIKQGVERAKQKANTRRSSAPKFLGFE